MRHHKPDLLDPQIPRIKCLTKQLQTEAKDQKALTYTAKPKMGLPILQRGRSNGGNLGMGRWVPDVAEHSEKVFSKKDLDRCLVIGSILGFGRVVQRAPGVHDHLPRNLSPSSYGPYSRP